MAKTFNNAYLTLTTSESDIYVATSKSTTFLIQAVNTTASDCTCEIWVTDGSNVHKASIIAIQTISGYNGVTDTSKHVIPNGYKIRGVSDTESAIFVEVSVLEGFT